MLATNSTDIADTMGVECFIQGKITNKRLSASFRFAGNPDQWIVVPVLDEWIERQENRYSLRRGMSRVWERVPERARSGVEGRLYSMI